MFAPSVEVPNEGDSMPETQDAIEWARTIADRLDADDSAWYRARTDKETFPWYGALLGELALLVQAEPIEYLSSKLKPQDDGWEVVIAIFTRDLLITTIKGADGETVTTAVPRASLNSIQVHGTASVFGDDIHSRWPGRYRVSLKFSASEDLGLPLGLPMLAKSTELVAFTGSLREDLGRA